MSETATLLLVHGSWHGPWCWEPLVPELERRGLCYATVDLPSVGGSVAEMGGMMDDVAAIEAAVDRIPGETIVVAHSYGGVPATQADYPSRVRHLVYLAAFMPDVGQSLVSLLPPGPLPPFVLADPDGSTRVNPDLAVQAFYPDLPTEMAAWAIERLRLHNAGAITTPVARAAWRSIPSTYLLMTDDQPCPTPVQRQVSRQAGHVHEMAGGHFPFLAHPAAVADLLKQVADGINGEMRRTG